ncbi:HAMP domain-containing sensor histidine kinase [Roseburia hominis]
MNKWYRSAPCKGALVVLEHIFAAVLVVSLFWLLSYPAANLDDVVFTKKEYEDSQTFETRFLSAANEVAWSQPLLKEFETDGAFDENKLVDLEAYNDKNIITGENQSGIAYHLGDLMKWGERGVVSEEDTRGNIVVCKREDGTYHYYYADEFRELVEKKEIQFSALLNDQLKEEWGIQDEEDVLNHLFAGAQSEMSRNMVDKDRKIIYTNCWIYDGVEMAEEYAPDGAENILEIVNNNPKWNGKLARVMEMLSYTVESISATVNECQNSAEVWSEGNTNFTYLIVDLESKTIYTNREAYQNFDSWKANVESITESGKYTVVTPKLADFKTNTGMSATTWKTIDGNLSSENHICVFAVDTKYPIQDSFYQEYQQYNRYTSLSSVVAVTMILGGIGFVVCLIWLTVIAGRNNREEGISLMFVDRIKTEIFLAIAGGVLVLALIASVAMVKEVVSVFDVQSMSSYLTYGESIAYSTLAMTVGITPYKLLFLTMAAVLDCAAGLFLWLGMARRIKARTLWENSLLKVLAEFTKLIFSHMNLIWKTVLAFGGFVLCQLLVILWYSSSYYMEGGFVFLLIFFVDLIMFVYLTYSAIGRERIKRGVETIAGGQVDFQIPLEGLKGEQLKVAQAINQIGDGLENAVEQSMKNERMKTDLITNVSHDIKTPLTSIINYVELLKRENFEDPKVQNYLKVLEEKSQRLKTLTEDVVEASKVSSGNIKLEMMNLNLVELINQTCAELEEKFEARNLTLLVKVPDEPVIINADGRRMWRVLANIFNNAAKYAMQGTRVYADLKRTGDEVGFTLKNISEQALNITADELTERFIRGDMSRSTEGSGLGLSIAKNLMELQGGSFELYLDGDLFKVVVRMKCVV